MALTEAFGNLQPHHWLAVLCLAAVVYKVAMLLERRRVTMRHMESFPGPPAHWLVGNVLEFKQDGTDLDKFVQFGKEYPYAFPMWFGPFACFLNIHHPDYVKTILTSTEPKDDYAYRFIEAWIGEGLLVSKGPKWFRHRRLLTPGFHYEILKPYVKLMSESANIMLDKWEIYAKSKESFELFEHVSLMTLDSIMKCAFSYSSNCQTDGTNAYIKAVYDLSHLINKRFRTFPYHSDLIFALSPHGYMHRKACRVAHGHTAEVIRQRKETLKEVKEMEHIKAKRNLDFLDILLFAKDRVCLANQKLEDIVSYEREGGEDENQQGLSDEDLRAEVDTFMFEGHDTTASGISFMLYCLACHPEHQNICRKEIMALLDGKDIVEWEDLHKMPYSTMCIKECLRLYPPVPGISRTLTKPMKFFDGRSLPEGCHIGVSVYGVHRNATVWENPNVFDPLRFLPENVSKRSPHAFVPFAAGPRNCIGQNFAMNEMKVVLALTLKKYELIEVPAFKPKIIPKVVLRSLNGIHIKIKPIDPEL